MQKKKNNIVDNSQYTLCRSTFSSNYKLLKLSIIYNNIIKTVVKKKA